MRRFGLTRRSPAGSEGDSARSTAPAPPKKRVKKITRNITAPPRELVEEVASQALSPRHTHKGEGLEKLSPRYQAFVDNYVISKNGSDAARKAGFSENGAHVTGIRLLRIPTIKAEIDRRLAADAEKLEITRERVLREMARIAFADMGHYMKVGPDGQPVLDFSGLTAEQTAALQEVTVEEFSDGRSDKREVRRVKFKLADKSKNLENLARHLNLFDDDNKGKAGPANMIAILLSEIDAQARGERSKVVEAEPIEGQ